MLGAREGDASAAAGAGRVRVRARKPRSPDQRPTTKCTRLQVRGTASGRLLAACCCATPAGRPDELCRTHASSLLRPQSVCGANQERNKHVSGAPGARRPACRPAPTASPELRTLHAIRVHRRALSTSQKALQGEWRGGGGCLEVAQQRSGACSCLPARIPLAPH